MWWEKIITTKYSRIHTGCGIIRTNLKGQRTTIHVGGYPLRGSEEFAFSLEGYQPDSVLERRKIFEASPIWSQKTRLSEVMRIVVAKPWTLFRWKGNGFLLSGIIIYINPFIIVCFILTL